MFKNHDAPDDVLAARVRSKLGRVVSHPHAIHVEAHDGCVSLSGPILANEVDALMNCAARVPGVHRVEQNLAVYEQAAEVPGLQGGRPRLGERVDWGQRNWSPSMRALASIGGGALLAWGLGRRSLFGLAASAAGAGLVARGVTNLGAKRLLGVGGRRRAIEFDKTININAPVEKVYLFWENYANFPHFMTNVREVRDLGHGRSHWVVAGPAGFSVEWDAVITKHVPNELLAWKSLPGATVENAGLVRFTPNEGGGTRVEVRLSYNPPAGAIGHAFATLFGANPKREMDADLLRMKSLIETGTLAHDAAQGEIVSHPTAARPAVSR